MAGDLWPLLMPQLKSTMSLSQEAAILFLRLSLAAGFLSAVASRLGLWGAKSSGWKSFLNYTAEVNSYAPQQIIPVIAIIATICEAFFGMVLVLGFKTGHAAFGAGLLTLLFAIAMTYSSGVKEPLDYSVFAFSAGAFMLSTLPDVRWSLDYFLSKST